MARQIVWSAVAEKDRKEILAYWIDRNGSRAFSLNLFKRINTMVGRLLSHPFMGRPSDIAGIRVLKIDHYLLFYEVAEDAIIIHHLWHGRRDLSKLSE